MDASTLHELLRAVAAGRLAPDAAVQRLRHLPFEDVGDTLVDHHRALRQPLAEVVYGAGKTAEQLQPIVAALQRQGSNVLVTRLDAGKAEALRTTFPAAEYDPLGRILSLRVAPPTVRPGRVLVVCAGTSDLPVAREAVVTARFAGHEVQELKDVGVAGLHRLLAHTEALRSVDVLIVVAGMEGALPSVVGGLVAAPVIAVPTSVGYGAAFDGVAALLGMLNSCAGGITVVNIDNGFGAAMAACRILAAREPTP